MSNTQDDSRRSDGAPFEPQAGTGPGATPLGLRWPLVWLWAIFRPLKFMTVQVHRQSAGAATIAALLNITAAIVIINAGIRSEDSNMGREDWIALAIAMPVLWLVGMAYLVCLTFLLAPAMSRAATLVEAVRDSSRVVSGMTAVIPVATLLCTLMACNAYAVGAGILDPVFGSDLAHPVFAALVGLCVFWPFLLLYVGLRREGAVVPAPEHEAGQRRCEQCGYNLVVTSPEGRCPECGHPGKLSTDPNRRILPWPENRPRRASPILWLATFLLAALRPATFWSDKRVRVDGRRARNAALTVQVLAVVAASVTFLLGFGAIWLLRGDDDLEDLGYAVDFSLLFSGLAFIVLLLGNPVVALAAVCISRLRGNESRIDELGRLAWYSVAVPQILFCLFAATTAVLGVAAGSIGRRHARMALGITAGSAEFWGQLLAVMACAAGVVAVGACLWSLVGSIRAMHSTRYANF